MAASVNIPCVVLEIWWSGRVANDSTIGEGGGRWLGSPIIRYARTYHHYPLSLITTTGSADETTQTGEDIDDNHLDS